MCGSVAVKLRYSFDHSSFAAISQSRIVVSQVAKLTSPCSLAMSIRTAAYTGPKGGQWTHTVGPVEEKWTAHNELARDELARRFERLPSCAKPAAKPAKKKAMKKAMQKAMKAAPAAAKPAAKPAKKKAMKKAMQKAMKAATKAKKA